jgi:hypothetical protein
MVTNEPTFSDRNVRIRAGPDADMLYEARQPHFANAENITYTVRSNFDVTRGVGSADSDIQITRVMPADAAIVTVSGVMADTRSSEEADRIAKKVKVVLNGCDVATSATIASLITGVSDSSVSYGPLFARCLAFGEALSMGAVAYNVAPAAAHLTATWPVGAGNLVQMNAMADSISNVVYNNAMSVFLGAYNYRGSVLTPEALWILWCLGQPGLNVQGAGGAVVQRGFAALFKDEMPVYIYGTTFMRPGGLAVPAAPVAANVDMAAWNLAMNFLVAVTASINGPAEGAAILANKVRFEGPEYTNLALPFHNRVHGIDNTLQNRARALFEIVSCCGTDIWSPWIVQTMPNVALRPVPADVLALQHQDWFGEFVKLADGMARFNSFYEWECAQLTYDLDRYYRVCSLHNPAEMVVPDVADEMIVHDLAQAPARVRFGRGYRELCLFADGLEGTLELPCRTGLVEFVGRISGVSPQTYSTQWRGQTSTSLLHMLYGFGIIRRTCTDSLVKSFRLSRNTLNVEHGYYNTGNIDLDVELASTFSGGDSLTTDEFFSLGYNNFKGLFGKLDSADSIHAVGSYFPDKDLRYSWVMPFVLHPALAGMIISWAGTNGGFLNAGALTKIVAADDRSSPFYGAGSQYSLTGLSRTETAGYYSIAGALSGCRFVFGLSLDHTGQTYAEKFLHKEALDTASYCRVSDNTRNTGFLISSNMWWFCPALPNARYILWNSFTTPQFLGDQCSDGGFIAPNSRRTKGTCPTYGGVVSSVWTQDHVVDLLLTYRSRHQPTTAIGGVAAGIVPPVPVPASQGNSHMYNIIVTVHRGKAMLQRGESYYQFRCSPVRNASTDGILDKVRRAWNGDGYIPSWALHVATYTVRGESTQTADGVDSKQPPPLSKPPDAEKVEREQIGDTEAATPTSGLLASGVVPSGVDGAVDSGGSKPGSDAQVDLAVTDSSFG